MASRISPFLHPESVAVPNKLAIIHLKRDLQVSTILKQHDDDDEGYAEGKVVNTRFGSFPHSTLIGKPWGSQILASRVDTGSRGRRGKGKEEKRKREESEATQPAKIPRLNEVEHEGEREGALVEAAADANTTQNINEEEAKEEDVATPVSPKGESEAVAAQSGFIHLLPPTPETWTSSLPHRTQVVYTPDYSYILHRIRARPGTSIIEAGAGSGSFTHASARAVYSGYAHTDEQATKRRKLGKVWSFEFHESRHEKLQKEIEEHGFEGLVQVTHRDVCEDGFLVDAKSPNAEAIFLDLPAPWIALRHLTRSRPSPIKTPSNNGTPSGTPNGTEQTEQDVAPKPFVSPLNPSTPVHICTFSPCIEQVQRTVSAMRKLGWVDISMVEVTQRRLEIRRERIGIDNGAQRGLQTTPASVDEALQRLIEVEGNFKSFHENGEKAEFRRKDRENPNNREKIIESLVERKVYKEGKLVHRTEPEVKTHTSYLVFAVLPMEWSEEDERKAREKWTVKIRREGDGKVAVDGEIFGMSKRQMKKAARQAQKDKAATTTADPTQSGLTSEADDVAKDSAEQSVEV
jgi:tRNA (adenine57-N1/adenine58-N1)-methyltransferase